MPETTTARLAKRHRCIHGIGVHCTRADGPPKRKRCGWCGGALLVESGLHGVFEWTGTGRYPAENAVKAFTSPALAERYTKRDTRYVVRWIPADDLPKEPQG
ncbi:MAG: hypothetical protein ACTHKG_06265 [Nocardioides sp.]